MTAATAALASGRPDLAYLQGALARAGLPEARGELRTAALLGGRTGATVQRLSVGERSFVLKYVDEHSWRIAGMGGACGEHRLWLQGVTRGLDGTIRCPVIDVAHEAAARRYWVLMHDVSAGIRERGKFSREDSRALFAALAGMQARYRDSGELEGAPLPSVTKPTDLLRKGVLHLSGRRRSDEAWLLEMIDDFKVMGALLPLFLEQLGPKLADEYLALVDDEEWMEALAREPQTFLHGDLRRANIAFDEGRIWLFDWEFASRGPAGSDLQHHCLLHYWAYPPDGADAGDDCDDLAQVYVGRLGAHLGRRVDSERFDRGWQLGWIRAMAQLGYILVDPIHPNGDAEARKRIAELCRRAAERALRAREALR